MHFSEKLAAAIKAKNSCLMLGLDPSITQIPKHLLNIDPAKPRLEEFANVYENFCCEMIEACADKVCGIKIQMGYFEVLGSLGIKAVENIIIYTRSNYPNLIIMMDAKRGDIGSTSLAYAHAFLSDQSPLAGDCVTVAPYMGTDSIAPFIAASNNYGTGVFVLTKTSNESSKDIQDLLRLEDEQGNTTVAEYWAYLLEGLSEEYKQPNHTYSNLGAVVGATHPDDLPKFRNILKSCWMLCPGVGAQGGKIEDVLAIRDEDGLGVLIPVSRSVLYASDGEDYLKAAAVEIEKLWEAQKM